MDQPKGIDRRIARTRRALSAALVDLILESGYARITIRALTQRADIGYATFFRHFKSKDDLTLHVLMTLIDDLESRLHPRMTIYDEALTLYRFVLEKQRIYHAAFRLPRSSPAGRTSWERIREFFHKRYIARNEHEIPYDASINHLTRSVWELIRWWLQEATHYSPEEIAKIHTELIVKVTEQVALNQREKSSDCLGVD